ncbi:MAG: hypothetical protein Harvfovirus1_94 [Harvfovirus sp.]|uniref:Uncharacterized protein n=1 Tax=Harvfovirus sp. TaxID=2487768 RepID=A0A3G5A4S2_9VIRU|nr:MAG: hypothetical protein Harvfovirus1_94 [Harvfovirus sp.]
MSAETQSEKPPAAGPCIPAEVESAESKLDKMKAEYEKKISKLSSDHLEFRKRVSVLLLLAGLYLGIYAWFMPVPPPAPVPIAVKAPTLEELVFDKIRSVTNNDLKPPHDLNQLDIYLSNVKYYYKNFGKYPRSIHLSTFFDTLLDSWDEITPEYTKKVLDLYETNLHPLDQNPNVITLFKNSFFLFDHNIDNYRTEHEKMLYNQRVSCIEEITSRISGKGIEDEILTELLKHQPQDFLFKLVKKYYPGAKLAHPRIAQYAKKAKWFEEMVSKGFVSGSLVRNFLRIALEHHTNHYIGYIITKLSELPYVKKEMSLELIAYYVEKKIYPDNDDFNLFGQLRMIGYHFNTEDIKSVSLEMNNLGREVKNLWDAIRLKQPEFASYYDTKN